jgi:outer membrane protein assembly factor BamE (lipoprotein component of BamABCDE complex)
MNTSRFKKSIAAFLGALCLAMCSAAGADSPAKEADSSATSPVKIRFKETNHDAQWIVLENSDCQFFVFYNDKTKKYKNRIGMNHCSAIANTTYKLVGDDVLVANFASERGGYVYVFHAAENKLYWINEKYKASDESEFIVTRNDSSIFVETDMTRIAAKILSNGKIEVQTDEKPHSSPLEKSK